MAGLADVAELAPMTVMDFDSVEHADEAIERLRGAGATDADIHVQATPIPTTAVTDVEFARIMKIALGIGIPSAYAAMVIISLLAGVQFGQALAMASIPAFFCGMFFVGSYGVVSALDRAEHRAHEQRRLLRTARTVVVTGPHTADAADVVAGRAATVPPSQAA